MDPSQPGTLQAMQSQGKRDRLGDSSAPQYPQPPRHSHKGLLPIIGFDAADIVLRGATQHLHQALQGCFELQRTRQGGSELAGAPWGLKGSPG